MEINAKQLSDDRHAQNKNLQLLRQQKMKLEGQMEAIVHTIAQIEGSIMYIDKTLELFNAERDSESGQAQGTA